MDLLHERNGQSLTELSTNLDMSRQAVTKHLKILESADLVIPVWKGKEEQHPCEHPERWSLSDSKL
ncbi:MAG TPA: helix-turn-helix domain-containing protein [Patescibacteria group bacterium]|nr:helix-turn-helix domain-containing protein [Patescibacteria group bacterium]